MKGDKSSQSVKKMKHQTSAAAKGNLQSTNGLK